MIAKSYFEDIFPVKKNYVLTAFCVVGGTWTLYRLVCQHRAIKKNKAYKKAISNFPRLSLADSLVAKYLTPDIYAKLFLRKTSNGITIDQILQTRCSVNSQDRRKECTPTGLIAGDEECYEVFRELFSPLIHELHQNFCHQDVHSSDMDFSKLCYERFNEDYIVSCSVKATRSIRGCRLPPCMSRAERKDMARTIKYALEAITGDIEGEYYPIGKILDKMEESWGGTSATDLLYHPSSRFWATSALTEGRGAWISKDFKLLVLVNIRKHVKIIATERSGDLVSVFERFCTLVEMFEDNLLKLGKQFMFSKHLGHITSDIRNLGSGMTVSVDVKIPLLVKDPRFPSMLEKLRLCLHNISDHSPDTENVSELSNVDCLGISEVDIVKTVFKGVNLLVDMEKRLEQGMKIDDLIIWKDP